MYPRVAVTWYQPIRFRYKILCTVLIFSAMFTPIKNGIYSSLWKCSDIPILGQYSYVWTPSLVTMQPIFIGVNIELNIGTCEQDLIGTVVKHNFNFFLFFIAVQRCRSWRFSTFEQCCACEGMSVYTLGSTYHEFVYCEIYPFIRWVPLTTNSFTTWYVCLYTGFHLTWICLLRDMSVYTLGSTYHEFVYCVICPFIRWVPLTTNSFTAYVCLYTGFRLQWIRLLRDMSVYTLGSAYNKFLYCVICRFIHSVPLTMNLFTAWYVCLYTQFHLQRICLLRDMSVYTLGSTYNEFVYCVICPFIHSVPLTMNLFTAWYVCLYTGFRLQRIRLLCDMSIYTLGSTYKEFVYCVICLFIHSVPLTRNLFTAWYVCLYTRFHLQGICLLIDMSVIHWVPLTRNLFTAWYVCLYTQFQLQGIRLLHDMSVYTLGPTYNEFVYYVICLFILSSLAHCCRVF